MNNQHHWCAGNWCVRTFSSKEAAERTLDRSTDLTGHVAYYYKGEMFRVTPAEISIVNDEELSYIKGTVK